MRSVQIVIFVYVVMISFFIPKAEAGFNLLGLAELGSPAVCEIKPLKESLKCPIIRTDEAIRAMGDDALLSEARATQDICRMVNLVHEYEVRFPFLAPIDGKAVEPSPRVVSAQKLRIERLIASGYNLDALYWIANYSIENANASDSTRSMISPYLSQTLDALISKAWALYNDEDYCDAAKALGNFAINENTHYGIARIDKTVNRATPKLIPQENGRYRVEEPEELEFVPANLMEYFPSFSDNSKWRESRFLQMLALYRGENFNEVRTAGRHYRRVEEFRVLRAKVKGNGGSEKIFSDLALFFEAQSYYVQIPRAEGLPGASLLGKVGVELKGEHGLQPRAAEQANELFIRLVERYGDSPIVRDNGLSAANYSRDLSPRILGEMASVFAVGGEFKGRATYAYEWLARKHLEIGKHYLKYKSGYVFDSHTEYHAAAMRFNTFLSEYPHSRHKSEALYYLSFAFAGMGDETQELETVELLEEVFPGDEWTLRARKEFEGRRKPQEVQADARIHNDIEDRGR